MKTPYRSTFSIALLASMIAPEIVAQEPRRAPAAADVVVTGRRLSPEEERTRAEAYVRRTGVAQGQQAAARWVDPICPRSLGLEPKLARYVEARIRSVAADMGAPLAPDRCAANAVVSFVEDAPAVARTIAAKQPRQFADVPLSARPALLAGTMPVRWWYSTELRGRDGDRMTATEPVFVSSGGASMGSVLPANGDTRFLSLYGNSIVSTQTARALYSASVLVDVGLATGATLDAVADYAAFVMLAEVLPSAKSRPDSIMGLFDERERRGTLTDLDARFLRELYRLPLDRQARQQRGKLVNALVR